MHGERGGTFCIVDYEKEFVITIASIRDDDDWENKNDHMILAEVKRFLDKVEY